MRWLPLVLLVACSGDGKDTGTTNDTGKTPNVDPNDGDGDGVAASEDCDDTDPTVFPGAPEHCDGIDQNCVDDSEVGIITLVPDRSFGTMADAAEVAVAGDTVMVCPGTYMGTSTWTVPVHIVGVTLDGVDGLIRPLLDGNGSGTTLRLEGDGSSAEFLSITGGTKSGLLAGQGAAVDVSDCLFEDNIGDFGGGVQFSSSGGSMTDCEVRNNIAQDDGGGIYANGIVTLTRLNIMSNVAGNWGGGLLLGEGGSLTMEDVTVSDNTAERGGGAFTRASTTVQAVRTTISDNLASASGGGIYLLGTHWTGGDIEGNDAIDAGGGAYLFEGGSLVAVTVERNTATRGGGVFGGGAGTIDDATIADNEADSDGGGLYLLEASFDIGSSMITGNNAPDGGGVYLQDSSLTGGVIQVNTADNGGGIYVYNVEETFVAQLANNRVEDNIAGASGGGVYLLDDADLTDLLVLRNLSQDRAGGVYITNEAEVQIEGTSIEGNTAVQRGGGLYTNTAALVDVDDSTIASNQALRGAGIYINAASEVELTASSVIANGDPTTVTGGGARVTEGRLVSISSDWGDGVNDNLPDDVYAELFGDFVGYGASSIFECTQDGCDPEP